MKPLWESLGVTGKAAVATVTAVLTASGVAAAGAVQVPLLSAGPPETSVPAGTDDEGHEDATGDDVAGAEAAAGTETSGDTDGGERPDTHGAGVSEFARTTDLEGCEKGQAVSELASSKAAERRNNPDKDHDPCERDDEVDAPETDEESDAPEGHEEDGERPDTHGAEVSEFARTTDLEGCEKGQAVSELASSKAAEHRNNPDRDHDPCERDDGEDADELEAPSDDGDDDADDSDDSGDSDDDADDVDESDSGENRRGASRSDDAPRGKSGDAPGRNKNGK